MDVDGRATPDRGSWVVRPVVWFAAASMITTILHEAAHAGTALMLGVRSTLFNYSASMDFTPEQAASHAPVVIRIAGPLFCLVFGALAWSLYRRARQSPAGLPLLYLSVFMLGTFFGNLMSAAFVGDFSAAAAALQLSMGVRRGIAVAGAVSVAALHFWAGRELGRRVPSHIGRVAGMLGIIAVPVILGMAVVMLVNQPMPRASVNARIAEAAFWLFAAVGALVTGREPQVARASSALRWPDVAMLLLAILAVRLAVHGIPFTL